LGVVLWILEEVIIMFFVAVIIETLNLLFECIGVRSHVFSYFIESIGNLGVTSFISFSSLSLVCIEELGRIVLGGLPSPKGIGLLIMFSSVSLSKIA